MSLTSVRRKRVVIVLLLVMPILLLLLSGIKMMSGNPSGEPVFIEETNTVEPLPEKLTLIQKVGSSLQRALQYSLHNLTEYMRFVWILWPGIFLYLWVRGYLSLPAFLLTQAYPYVIALVGYVTKWPNAFSPNQTPKAWLAYLLPLFIGYLVGALFYLYLKLTGAKEQQRQRSGSAISPAAKDILSFLLIAFVVSFLVLVLFNQYSVTVIEKKSSLDSVMKHRQYRSLMTMVLEFFLTLWPAVIVFLLYTQRVSRRQSWLLLVPLMQVGLVEFLSFMGYRLFGFARGVELYWLVLLQPVARGYLIGALFALYLFATKSYWIQADERIS